MLSGTPVGPSSLKYDPVAFMARVRNALLSALPDKAAKPERFAIAPAGRPDQCAATGPFGGATVFRSMISGMQDTQMTAKRRKFCT